MPHRTVLAHSGTEPLQKVRQILWIRSRDLQKKTTTKNNPQCISLGVSLKRSKRIFDFEKVWGSLGHLKFEDFYPVDFFEEKNIFSWNILLRFTPDTIDTLKNCAKDIEEKCATAVTGWDMFYGKWDGGEYWVRHVYGWPDHCRSPTIQNLGRMIAMKS